VHSGVGLGEDSVNSSQQGFLIPLRQQINLLQSPEHSAKEIAIEVTEVCSQQW
jgi:hypothetical protein